VTCRDALHLVEAIAAADFEVGADVREHFESCPPCAAALASARRIEAALVSWPQASAPADLASAVLARVREERWTSEQRIDRIFNLAIAFALVVVVGSVAALANLGGVIAAAEWVWGVGAATSAQLARQAAPVVATYVGAAGVLMSAMIMWWWAEQRLSL